MRTADYLIVGGGLAGTTLAWHLLDIGATVLLIDPDPPVSSSKIAAGLMTPVTGKRLVASARFGRLWLQALAFYRQIEARTGVGFFRETPMLRLFADGVERDGFETRHRLPADTPIRVEPVADGFVMSPAGRLDVASYLAASREAFRSADRIVRETLVLPDDVAVDTDGVRLPRLGLRANSLIFCEGAAGRSNPFLPPMDFNPVKGEILTLRLPEHSELRPIHRGVWLAHRHDDIFLAGSTWDWDHLDEIPTHAGRETILAGIRPLVTGPIEVVDHRAAVRPTLRSMRQAIGRLPDRPRLAVLNGLGSRGSLLVPWLAEMLAQHLVRNAEIDPEVRILTRAVRGA